MDREVSKFGRLSLAVTAVTAFFGLGYSAGATVHGLIDDQHVTLVISSDETSRSPNHDYPYCQDEDGGAEIASIALENEEVVYSENK